MLLPRTISCFNSHTATERPWAAEAKRVRFIYAPSTQMHHHPVSVSNGSCVCSCFIESSCCRLWRFPLTLTASRSKELASSSGLAELLRMCVCIPGATSESGHFFQLDSLQKSYRKLRRNRCRCRHRRCEALIYGFHLKLFCASPHTTSRGGYVEE